MVKLYFKKLLSIVVHALICATVLLITTTFMSYVADMIENPFLKLIVIFALPITIVCAGVFFFRTRKKALCQDYLEKANPECMTFADEWRYITTSPHFLAEVYAFGTFALGIPFALIIGTADSLVVKIILIWIAFLLLEGPFYIMDFTIWVLVHAAWRKKTEGKNE